MRRPFVPAHSLTTILSSTPSSSSSSSQGVCAASKCYGRQYSSWHLKLQQHQHHYHIQSIRNNNNHQHQHQHHRPSPCSPLLISTRCFRDGHQYSKLRNKQKKHQPDPFQTLGLFALNTHQKEKGEHVVIVEYALVKKTFLQLAMKHHPDTTTATTPEELEKHKQLFMEMREAFERIVEGPDGRAILREETEKNQQACWHDENEFNSWFHQETGHDMPFMDAQTMKEVAEMTETVGGGLDRDGGMWTLARMVTQNLKNGGDGMDVLRLEAGDVRSREINGVLRRRRKR